MMRMVMCRKLGKELPGLDFLPFDMPPFVEFGQRLYDEVSQEAWDLWLKESPKYINTYRLDLADPKAQDFLLSQMEVYFGFKEGDLAQTAWVAPKGHDH